MLWTYFAISLGINAILFLIAYRNQTDKLTDLAYSLSFILVSAFAWIISSRGLSQTIAVVMVWCWALRLGYYLVKRINKIGRDKRFDDRRQNFWRFGSFWLLQAIAVVLIMAPLLLTIGRPSEFRLVSLAGFGVWMAGLAIESLADSQKYRFIASGSRRWIDSGLWRYSRHPNYLGEILIWIGLYLYCMPYLGWARSLVGLISPLLIFILLRFVSGVPILEKNADQKWGKNEEYLAYKSRTGILMPKIIKQ